MRQGRQSYVLVREERPITASNNNFHLLSSHGAVLFYVAVYPDCTIEEIAEAMCLTRRTVWGLIGGLRRVGAVHVRKEGRRHHYSVNLDGPLLHPTISGYTLRPVLSEVIKRAHHHAQANV